MAVNVQRSSGRPSNYKFDKGGMPTEMGPFIGEVMNNVDPTRSGRLQVFIEQFAGDNKEDESLWRTVSYCPPFYGATPKSSSSSGTGDYPGNQGSYGMWFNPPDLGVKVLCFFVAGDPNQGYYTGCIPEQGQNRMTPAIGAVSNYVPQNKDQETYFTNDERLPVTEINNDPKNVENVENPQFFDVDKPVHSYVAAILFQQGLNKDIIRGAIGSSSQRESPSSVFGISSPGRPIYAGGAKDSNIKQQAQSSGTNPNSVNVIGRRGGHSIIMDDGDLEGKDNLLRIRTAKGHQITMSDDGDCFYISHANGQTWIELGKEGTVDVYSTNSVNVRTEGVLNLHADKDINMYAGGKFNIKSAQGTYIQSDLDISIASKTNLTIYSEAKIGVKANGSLGLISNQGAWDGAGSLSFTGGVIDLNGGPKISVTPLQALTTFTMPDTEFNSSTGWETKAGQLESIVTRAPTHEPYPYHNLGVNVKVSLENGQPSPPPSAPAVQKDWSITRK